MAVIPAAKTTCHSVAYLLSSSQACALTSVSSTKVHACVYKSLWQRNCNQHQMMGFRIDRKDMATQRHCSRPIGNCHIDLAAQKIRNDIARRPRSHKGRGGSHHNNNNNEMQQQQQRNATTTKQARKETRKRECMVSLRLLFL
jgi:hypothetical protein